MVDKAEKSLPWASVVAQERKRRATGRCEMRLHIPVGLNQLARTLTGKSRLTRDDAPVAKAKKHG